MAKVQSIIAAMCIAVLGASGAAGAAGAEGAPGAPGAQEMWVNMTEAELMGVMNKCNETFPTDMEYLDSLNASGSFPDETLKPPKCFIRCFLEAAQVMADGKIDADNARDLFKGERGGQPMDKLPEFIEECRKDRAEACLCERAYAFVRCLMEKEIEKYDNKKK